MLYPLTFRPIFKERVWGGRELERIYGKELPPDAIIGESWELSDRPGDISVIQNGPLKGTDLHQVLREQSRDLLGNARICDGRFPLLIKLLDAREKLSLQVHPPAIKAAELGGDPKTEMWYIAHADLGAELYVGLRKGVSRAEFENKVRSGSVSECFHRVSVKTGDAMFLPSGRVHAIGAGLVIFEIQQNSDTTYRVYDWDRVGLDGKPRQLHVQESLASIDFTDVEPALVSSEWRKEGESESRLLVSDPLFSVASWRLASGNALRLPQGEMHIIGSLKGDLVVEWPGEKLGIRPGTFCLVPASGPETRISAEAAAEFLHVTADSN